MRTKVCMIAAILLIVLATIGYAEGPPISMGTSEDLVVLLRILPGASQETLSYVANLAEPEPHQTSGQKTYKQIARDRYGVFNHNIRTLMKKFNPQLTSFDAKPTGTVYLPVGPRWSFKVEVKLPTGSSISKELVLRSGYAGKNTLQKFIEENPKWAKILDKLPAWAKLKFPFVAQMVSFRLKPDYASRRKEIEEKLNSLRGIKDAQILASPKMTPSLTQAHLASLSPLARPTAATPPFWPYTSFCGQSNQILIPRLDKALVAVLDTGIPSRKVEPRLYGPFLWKNLDEIPDNGRDDDENSYVDDVYGVDLVSYGSNYFPEDDNLNGEVTYHGTHVAGLLAGILLPEENRKQV